MRGPVSGCSKVDAAGKITQLGSKPAASVDVTEDDVSGIPKLARLISGIMADIATLRARYYPRCHDFEGVVCGTIGATTALLEHGFGGGVRWWIVNWTGASAGPSLVEYAAGTTATTIQFQSYVAGTATVRVEEAG